MTREPVGTDLRRVVQALGHGPGDFVSAPNRLPQRCRVVGLDDLAHARAERVGEHGLVDGGADQDHAQRRPHDPVAPGERRGCPVADRRAEHDDQLRRVAAQVVLDPVERGHDRDGGADRGAEDLGQDRVLLDDGGHRRPRKISGMMSRCRDAGVAGGRRLVGAKREREVTVAGCVDDPLCLLLVDRDGQDRARDLLGRLLAVLGRGPGGHRGVTDADDLHLGQQDPRVLRKLLGGAVRLVDLRVAGGEDRDPRTRVHEARDACRVGQLDADGQLVVGDGQGLLGARVPELLADDLLAGVDRVEGDLLVDGRRGAQRALDHVVADHVGLLELAGGLGVGHGLADLDHVGRGEDLDPLLALGGPGIDALDVEDDHRGAQRRDGEGDAEEDGSSCHGRLSLAGGVPVVGCRDRWPVRHSTRTSALGPEPV